MSRKLTIEEFIERSNILHNNKFNYNNVLYIDYRTKIKIICPIHGEFEQIPATHLQGIGCKKCGVEKRASKRRFTINDFIKEANKVHKDLYDYSNVNYKNAYTSIEIFCKKCKNKFIQKPYSHLAGHGCPKCNLGVLTGWSKTYWTNFCKSKNRSSLVYIIRCFNENENFIKIGKTSTSTKGRFSCSIKLPYSFEIIKEIKGSPDFIFDKEVELHRLYKKFKYKPLLEFGGQTECFNISILNDFI